MFTLSNILSFCLGVFITTIFFLFIMYIPFIRYLDKKKRMRDAELLYAQIEQSVHDTEESEKEQNEAKGRVERIDTIR